MDSFVLKAVMAAIGSGLSEAQQLFISKNLLSIPNYLMSETGRQMLQRVYANFKGFVED